MEWGEPVATSSWSTMAALRLDRLADWYTFQYSYHLEFDVWMFLGSNWSNSLSLNYPVFSVMFLASLWFDLLRVLQLYEMLFEWGPNFHELSWNQKIIGRPSPTGPDVHSPAKLCPRTPGPNWWCACSYLGVLSENGQRSARTKGHVLRYEKIWKNTFGLGNKWTSSSPNIMLASQHDGPWQSIRLRGEDAPLVGISSWSSHSCPADNRVLLRFLASTAPLAILLVQQATVSRKPAKKRYLGICLLAPKKQSQESHHPQLIITLQTCCNCLGASRSSSVFAVSKSGLWGADGQKIQQMITDRTRDRNGKWRHVMFHNILEAHVCTTNHILGMKPCLWFMSPMLLMQERIDQNRKLLVARTVFLVGSTDMF